MTARLRIAQIAPIDGVVTPDSGGIDGLVSLLTEELVRRGHAVTLFAAGTSRTSARLHAVYPTSYHEDDDLWDWPFHEIMNAAAAFERAGEFEVIHSHAYHYALPFTRLAVTPALHTYHTLPNPDIVALYARHPETRIAAISDYQRSRITGIPDVPVVYNGIDTDRFPAATERGEYLCFLGRMIPHKGPVEAIQVARQAGMRLVMAGPGGDYFESAVQPLVDGSSVEYVGPVGVQERNALLAGAAALVYPLNVAEPFGLVMVEAMACGTPVAALARGAVREIVENGVTGYQAADLDALAAVIPDTLRLNRAAVRQRAVQRFDYRRMVDGYLALYAQIVAERGRTAV